MTYGFTFIMSLLRFFPNTVFSFPLRPQQTHSSLFVGRNLEQERSLTSLRIRTFRQKRTNLSVFVPMYVTLVPANYSTPQLKYRRVLGSLCFLWHGTVIRLLESVVTDVVATSDPLLTPKAKAGIPNSAALRGQAANEIE